MISFRVHEIAYVFGGPSGKKCQSSLILADFVKEWHKIGVLQYKIN